MSLGRYSDAARSLLSFGIHSGSNEVYEDLVSKHPVKPLPAAGFLPPTANPTFTGEEIFKVLETFANGTACGPSGDRVEFWIDITRIYGAEILISSMARFATIMAAGGFARNVACFYGGATLVALKKKAFLLVSDRLRSERYGDDGWLKD